MTTTLEDDPPRSPLAPAQRRFGALTLLFALTSFAGAALLFVVQPMVARLLLPHFGGSASVWSTSNLFFQTLLLVGYLYVHVATRRLRPKTQPLVHVGVLLLPLLVLPVALPPLMDQNSSPVTALLSALTVMIGLPFVVMSSTGPLLQRWYSWTGLQRSDDPYFLFATSNLGSFGGLLAYPFLIEPFLTLDQQRTAWSWGFVVFLLLMSSCAFLARRGAGRNATVSPDDAMEAAEVRSALPTEKPTLRTVCIWLFLAFLPSTLMLSVTSHISTDIAAVPLMWVIPLAIYLATFVVAFAKVDRDPGRAALNLSLAATVLLTAVAVSDAAVPLAWRLVFDLFLLTVGAYAAHARLASLRPSPEHLTRFYLVVAAGGALGGLLNGVIAPVFFDRVWEYPLALLGLVFLSLGRGSSRRGRYHPGFTTVALGIGLAAVLLVMHPGIIASERGIVVTFLLATVTAVGIYVSRRRPMALAVSIVITLILIPLATSNTALYRDRTFYGSYVVNADGDKHRFVHGTTLHGVQNMKDEQPEPLSYYGRSGPVGEAMAALPDAGSIGVVGLGVGTMAAYLTPEQSMTFFEIDPEVIEVASDPSLFTYLSTSRGTVTSQSGDGRLSLERGPKGAYDILMLDAFTSDAIPVHLLTREAFASYAEALTEDGVIMVHISNRVFDLEPVLAAAAESLGWHALSGRGENQGDDTMAHWIALSPDASKLAPLADHEDWEPLGEKQVEWTDDFSSILSVLHIANR